MAFLGTGQVGRTQLKSLFHENQCKKDLNGIKYVNYWIHGLFDTVKIGFYITLNNHRGLFGHGISGPKAAKPIIP